MRLIDCIKQILNNMLRNKWIIRLIEMSFKFSNLLIILVSLGLLWGWAKYLDIKIMNVIKDVPFEMVFGIFLTTIFVLGLNFIVNKVENILEDSRKLTLDYNYLFNNYKKIEYLETKKVVDEKVKLKLPVVVLKDNSKAPITIIIKDNKESLYQLPAQILNNFESIFEAHGTSNIYNNIVIRLNDIKAEKDCNEVVLSTGRSTYFNSLVTNRAMDFEYFPNLTIRKLYHYDKKLEEFKDSLLSNHIGVNGCVFTADNKLVLVHRSSHLSVSKSDINCSVSGVIKSKYCLENDSFTLNGLINTIKGEIMDELYIDKDAYDFSIENNIVSIIRNIVEGGKPEIIFAVKLKDLTSNDVEDNFSRCMKSESNNRDGNKLLFVNYDNIKFDSKYRIHLNKRINFIKKYYFTTTGIATIELCGNFYSKCKDK